MNYLERVTVKFNGGCEILFDDATSIHLDHVVQESSTVRQLVALLTEKYVKSRPELFADVASSSSEGMNPRPGILVLVNSCDVEVYGGMDYRLQNGDLVEFISTLHGG